MLLSILKTNDPKIGILLESYEAGRLDPSELSRSRPSHATRRACALAMVRDLLAKNGLLSSEDARRTTIEHRPSGEPYLSMPNEMTTRLHISISHSGLWCACLISDADQPAGIDLEDLSKERDFLHLAEHYFSKDEIEWVKKEGKLPFYKLWTAREAIAKRNGKGLSEALKIELHPISLSTGAVVVENCKCYLTQHITENYIYTIAT